MELQSFRDSDTETLEQIINLDQSQFPFPWGNNAWKDIVEDSSYKLFFLKENRGLVGFILFKVSVEDALGHLVKISVEASLRESGIGRFLLEKSLLSLKEIGAQEIYLEVEEGNTAAIRLYCSYGLEVIHMARSYYSNGANALVFKGQIKD